MRRSTVLSISLQQGFPAVIRDGILPLGTAGSGVNYHNIFITLVHGVLPSVTIKINKK